MNQIKYNIIAILVLVFVIPLCGQKLVIGEMGGDSTNVITHDSTGYGNKQPLDIPDDKGMFIYSNNGNNALRIYGSFRMLFALDNRQQFIAYSIDPPVLPTGEDDFENMNATWTPNMSRLGIDALFGNRDGGGFLVRFELDWKGTTEAFRIRHMFMRTNNWLIGKTWTSFVSFPYLAQTVEGHMTGAAFGQRVPQIRYYNSIGNWKYQISAEYLTASLIMPNTVQAVSRVIIPSLVGRLTYKEDWGQTTLCAMVKPNRVQYTGADKKTQSLTGYGASLAAKFNIGEFNNLSILGYTGSGFGRYVVDYAYTDIELIYNPQSEEFENMDLYGGFLGFQHDWSKTLSSTLAGGYNYAKNKNYQDDLAFNYSYKAMVNLFYKATKKMNGLVIGVEVLYAERFNKNNSSNKAMRASLLMYYDF